MNFIISLCRITAASKIFSRNFYLPLLKPVTPKDALRTFKITGKWLMGAKRQHYIPVLLKHSQKRSKNAKDYGKTKHVKVKNCKYITPILDPETNENHKLLCAILDSESGPELYVYTLQENKVSVILSAPIEMALRRGDIVDVLLSQRIDRILFKLKDNKIPIEVSTFEGNDDVLYKGEGATTAEEEQNHHHGKYTMSLAQYFEDKERQEEEWEKELKKLMEKRNKQKGEGTKEWNDMISAGKKNLDWKQFEKEAKKVIEFINEPVVEQYIPMEVDDIDKTKDAEMLMSSNENLLNKLPTMAEIPDLINNLSNAQLEEINIDNNSEINDKRSLTGVKVTLSSGKEVFLIGQIVKTDDGDVFVPGQTIENEFGLEYAPGITVLMDNKPSLINGLIVGEKDTNNPMFVPTEATITEEGNLSFTVTKEDRTKYTPIKIPKTKTRRNRKKKNVTKEVLDDIINEVKEEPQKEVKKRVKKIVKKKKKPVHVVQKVEIDPGVIYEENFIPEMFKEVEIVPYVQPEEKEEEPDDEMTQGLSLLQEYEKYSELERLLIRTMDDQIEKIISSLEIKKSELKAKLQELQDLASFRQTNPVCLATPEDAEQIAKMITNDPNQVGILQDVLLTMMHKLIIFPDKSSINLNNVDSSNISDGFLETFDERYKRCNDKLKIALKTGMIAANNALKSRPKDEVSVLKAIGAVLILALKDKNNLVNDLCEFMGTAVQRNTVNDLLLKELSHKVQENKIKILKSVAKTTENNDNLVEMIAEVLHVEGDGVFKSAFKKIAFNNKPLLKKIIELIKGKIKLVTTEQWAYDVARDSVLKSVQEIYEENLQQVLSSGNPEDLLLLKAESEGYARILNHEELLDNLSKGNVLTNNNLCLNAFRRVFIMRKLAENDYGFRAALREISKDPTFGKTNPRVIQLIKESASLSYNRIPLRSSKEISSRLLEDCNRIALEELLLQRGVFFKPVLVSKNGVQVVIPKEDTKEVRSGRIPYVLVDEDGVINFKPSHMFSMFKLGKNDDINVDVIPRRGSYPENVFPERKKARQDLRKQIRRLSQFNHRMVA